ncbi:hypothetical protein [Aquiflexum lacus]|uniref:hypothetical protein n=1 Tax=Aquiflexum lacus TaxID=2483805 RepID=UPI001893799B|nr:hypothetical protein [Aquiflexum lacus]
MNKIKNAGNGFVELNGSLLNLKAFKEINKEYLGFESDDGKDYSISFTPISPSKEDWENGVERTWHIRYSDEKERDSDFEIIQESLAD